MKGRLYSCLLLVIAMLASTPVSAQRKQDQVVMADGDRFVGENQGAPVATERGFGGHISAISGAILLEMARPGGLEPPTLGLEGRCSIP
jgi:hypothetical protein